MCVSAHDTGALGTVSSWPVWGQCQGVPRGLQVGAACSKKSIDPDLQLWLPNP